MLYADPHYLWLLFLVPALLLFYFVTAKLKTRALALFGQMELVRKLMKSVSRRRRLVKKMLLTTQLVLMVLALARPQFGTIMREVHRKGVDIFIVLDTSLSMLAEDISPNRLERAKLEITSFLDLLQGDRVGLVCFAGLSFVQCPLTLDYGAAKIFLEVADTNLIPVQGTAIGNAIRTAVDGFRSKELKYKAIILITDGEDHETDPIAAAEYARDNGVIIYTIGLGSQEGNPIPLKDKRGTVVDRKKSKDGSVVISKLNETTLLKIASITGGKYHRATTGQLELEKIYDTINQMEKRELASNIKTFSEDRFQYFLFVALLLLAIETVVSERKSVLAEWKGRFK
ncbi:VWA domain-containing protein [bacterium]|nr:VWA domain-containing protein [bacterium]